MMINGTAIISCAALLNALELSEKNRRGTYCYLWAGAAAISCTRLYKAFEQSLKISL